MNFSRDYLDQLSREELVDMLMKGRSDDASPNEDLFDIYTREIIKLSPDALLILNPEDMSLVACNQMALLLLKLETREELKSYLSNLFRERPLFHDLLMELSSTFSGEPEVSMEVEFDTHDQHQRFGDLLVRKVEVLGRQFMMLRIIDITEVKQTQMQVLDSERQLEMAQEIAQIGSYIYLQDEAKFIFSKAFFQLLDLETTDPKPDNFSALEKYVVEDDRGQLREALKQIYVHKKDTTAELRILTQKGITKYLFCKVKTHLNDFGDIDKLVGTIQDITERVMTEKQLHESQELYRLTVENTNDGVWYWNFRDQEKYMSPKFEKTLGFEDEVITRESVDKWFRKVHPDERQAYRDLYEECVRGHSDAFRMEFRYQNSDGDYIWVESGAALIRDDQNQPHYLLGTIREIQDRKEAEFQLKEQERFLSMAQSVAHVGSWIWDRISDTLQCSDELYCIMELDKSLKGKPLGDEVISQVVEEDKEKVNRFLADSGKMEDGKQHIIEAKIQVPSGKIKVLRTTAQVYSRNLQGEVAQLIGTMQDITEDKRREQELVEAKEQAEISQRAKDRFLQIVSHEIRNPLNAIVGITHLLEQSELGQTQQEQLATLSFSSRHLLSIINDILDTAKLQYGNIKLDRTPFSLSDQLYQIEELFRPLAAEQQTTLLFTLDQELPELVMGDPTRFNQIIFNLLSNAVKYTYRGTIHLEAKLIEKEVEFARLEFKVSDSGIGIPEGKLNKVFEAFEQFDLPESQQKGGTGLGLYIVNELVKLMDGSIRVDSDFGKGTTFTITLAFDHARDHFFQNEKNIKPQADLSGCRILYVEDAHYNQLLLKGYAQVWKLQLDVASNIKEALHLTGKHHYDMILTDYRLPDGTGVDVARGLEELDIRKNTPLIVISAYQLKEGLEQYIFDDYLQKPINFDKFFYVLRKYLDKKNASFAQDGYHDSVEKANPLQYLEKIQPKHFQRVVENLVEELPDFQEQLLHSIDTHNYRLYLMTVHKLSSALKMIKEQELLDYLQNMEDLPGSEQGKRRVKSKIKNSILEIIKKCNVFKLSGKIS